MRKKKKDLGVIHRDILEWLCCWPLKWLAPIGPYLYCSSSSDGYQSFRGTIVILLFTFFSLTKEIGHLLTSTFIHQILRSLAGQFAHTSQHPAARHMRVGSFRAHTIR